MNSPQRESLRSLRVIRTVVAVAAAGAVGRVLWYSAVDAFLVYVFGDPAPQGGERLKSAAAPAPTSGTSARQVSERLVA